MPWHVSPPLSQTGVYELRRYNRHQVEALLNGYLRLSFKHLKDLHDNDDMPALDRIIISIIHKAVESGDHMRLNALLDRMIGKVKEIPEEVIDLDKLSPSEMLKLGKEAIKTLEMEAQGG